MSRTTAKPILVMAGTFAVAASLLWLIALFSTHSVLFPTGPNFEDIIVYKGRFTLFHTARFFTSRAFSAFAYPAGAALVYEAFYSTAEATQAYLFLTAITLCTVLSGTCVFLQRQGLAKLFPALLVLSFPLVFLIQRANIEIVLWILIAAGIILYRRGLAVVAAVLFGLAAAIKLYPIFLLGLFLKPKSTRSRSDSMSFLAGLCTAGLATLIAIAHTGPTFSFAAQGFFTGVDRFQVHYVDTVSKAEVLFDHCLFSPVKYLAYLQHASPASWRIPYYLVAGTFAIALFVRVHKLPFLNRIVFLVAATVCLPPVSFTYTLVHLYLPLLLLLVALNRTTEPPTTAYAALALLLFLMLPLPALAVLGAIPTGPLASCALLALMTLSALRPWHDFATTPTL